MNILVVEDNKINRMVLTKFIEKLGHKPFAVEDGREALELIKQGTAVDLILMDVEMPGLDGVETTKRIREYEETTSKRLPIIALTAHSGEEEKQRFLSAGMDGVLGKPIDKNQISSLIESM